MYRWVPPKTEKAGGNRHFPFRGEAWDTKIARALQEKQLEILGPTGRSGPSGGLFWGKPELVPLLRTVWQRS